MLFLTIFYKYDLNPKIRGWDPNMEFLKLQFIILECTKSVTRFNVSVSTIGMMRKFSRSVLEYNYII